MKMWKRASGLLKDQSSLFLNGILRRSTIWNPDIEAAVIKATSHDEFSFGYDNPERVYEWLRMSDSNMQPVVWCIAARVEKTRSWVVALKALMLTHGVLCTKLPGIESIGKLPFNLTDFRDGHTENSKTWGHNIFIRVYFMYLDQKSVLLTESFSKGYRNLMQEVVFLQKLQVLIDLLLKIKSQGESSSVFLIVEAMEGVVFEVFDIYSKLCRGITDVMKKIGLASKDEAILILQASQRALNQCEEIQVYFKFCKEIGVGNASSYPLLPHVSKRDIQVLENIVHGLETDKNLHKKSAIVLWESLEECDIEDDSKNTCREIVTSNLEKIDQDLATYPVQTDSLSHLSNPVFDHSVHSGHKNRDLPDLISF